MALITPDYLQTKSYAAKRDRRVNQALVPQEGIWDFGHFKATQRGAGANMSVDIAAGEAWVDGDSAVDQGFYHVVNDATVNVAIANNASGNPRIDQIVLKVNDSADAGSGTDTPALEVIQGTPSAGATLANRTGAAAVPNTALKLADVLVANGAVKIENAQIGNLRYPKSGIGGNPTFTSPLSIAGAPAQYALGRPASYTPSCRAVRSGNQEIPNTAANAIAFNGGDEWDTEEIHNPASENTKLICKTPGLYTINGRLEWDAAAGTYAGPSIRVNGNIIEWSVVTGGYWGTNIATTYALAYGDYVELYAHNSSGAARFATGVCRCGITWVGA